MQLSRMYRNYILAQFPLFVLFGSIQLNMVICFIMFLLIFNVLINIHEYANEILLAFTFRRL